MRQLFPSIEPFSKGYLNKGLHEIYYEQSGNPDGYPMLFLHGGPGGGGDINARRFFDPNHYKIIILDQRGSGRSKPLGCVEDNTTQHLIEDIHEIKNYLKIKCWHVFGGSWGSTLSLAYAQAFPNEVSALILRGIFLLRKRELDWFYQYGASEIYPDAWENYISVIKEPDQDNLLSAFYELIHHADNVTQMRACKAWSQWEGATSKLVSDRGLIDHFASDDFALALAKIETHYFMNRGFFSSESQVLQNIDKIRHIPSVIIQGRYDVVCPSRTAYELHQAWPEADFKIAEVSGHSAYEKEITDLLIEATEKFKGI